MVPWYSTESTDSKKAVTVRDGMIVITVLPCLALLATCEVMNLRVTRKKIPVIR